MPETNLPSPEHERAANALSVTARELAVITNQIGFDRATQFVKDVKARRKVAKELFGPVVQRAHEAHKTALAAYNRVDGPMAVAEELVKRGMGDYHVRMEEARKREEDRVRRELEAEQRDDIQEQAMALELSGESEAAEITALAPVQIPDVSIAAQSKPEGVAIPMLYSAELVDMNALIDYLGTPAGRQFRGLVKLNDTAADDLARSLRDSFAVPGLRLKKTPSVRVTL